MTSTRPFKDRAPNANTSEMSTSALGELITVLSRGGLQLEGIVYRHPSSETTVVHVHGSFGNFYQGPLVKTMATAYVKAGLNFLSVNMASHDGLAEGYGQGDEFEYVGGGVATFERCVDDIADIVTYARQFSDRIILQGHSLGCDRVLQFSITEGSEYELVLLAPCDSHQLQAEWIAPETVDDQITRLRAEAPSPREPFDWLPAREYGIKGGGDWTYRIPVMRAAFLSIAEGPPYRLIKLKQPDSYFLHQRALVMIGGNDALQVWPSDEMFTYLRGHIADVEEAFLPSADHMFSGLEEEVAARIIQWACSSSSRS